MNERILIISDKKRDLDLLEEILGSKGFKINGIPLSEGIEDLILKNGAAAILTDYDLVGERAYGWLRLLQENRSRSCFILYGEKGEAEKISEMLQTGAYGFVPRSQLSERIYDTILGGLENRKAFIAILAMFDELSDVNERLEREKEAFRIKNRELDFINRLSSEVAYDLDWDRILPRILDAGLLRVIDPGLFSILYRIGSKWNLALYLPEMEINDEELERLKEDIVNRFFSLSKVRIPIKEMILHLYPSDLPATDLSDNARALQAEATISFSGQWSLPLSLAGKPLGMLSILPKNGEELKKRKMDLMSTISNILAMSLKNAQEYHRLKEMAVTDGLTGIFNYKGLRDFIKREFHRARRHNKPLSLVMIDMDEFKAVNDSLGHLAGDYILRELADCLKGSIRNTDIVGRYGGDEFAILLPETEMDKSEALMKRILHAIKNHTFEWGPESIKVEITYGIATITELEKEDDDKELILKADSRLYHAKRSRNLPYQE